MHNLRTGVLDNDHEGKTGRGTIFYLEITRGLEIIERHEYGLLEVVDGRFDRNAITEKYREADKAAEAEIRAKADAKAIAEKQSRMDSLPNDPKLLALVKEAVEANPGIIKQIHAGRDKASNTLVGWVMNKVKDEGKSNTNPAHVAVILKKFLADLINE